MLFTNHCFSDCLNSLFAQKFELNFFNFNSLHLAGLIMSGFSNDSFLDSCFWPFLSSLLWIILTDGVEAKALGCYCTHRYDEIYRIVCGI